MQRIALCGQGGSFSHRIDRRSFIKKIVDLFFSSLFSGNFHIVHSLWRTLVTLWNIWIWFSTGVGWQFSFKCSSHIRGKMKANEWQVTWQICDPGKRRQKVTSNLQRHAPRPRHNLASSAGKLEQLYNAAMAGA